MHLCVRVFINNSLTDNLFCSVSISVQKGVDTLSPRQQTNLRVPSVSSKLMSAGLMVAIMAVRELPPARDNIKTHILYTKVELELKTLVAIVYT